MQDAAISATVVRRLINVVLAGAAVALLGCAKTDMTGFADPDFRGRAQFANVMVFGDRMTLAERELAEASMVDAFRDQGILALRSLDYAPPTRGKIGEQLERAVLKTGVDTLLILTLVGTDTESSYVPRTYHPGRSYSTVTIYGNYGYVDTYTSPGYTTGGYTRHDPVASYQARLIEMPSDRVVWRGEGRAYDGGFGAFKGFMDFDDLTVSASQETVRNIVATGVFVRPGS